ncbi:hypothetical protein AN932_24455, partial [Mycobacterium intracellulare subsp. chimaera]
MWRCESPASAPAGYRRYRRLEAAKLGMSRLQVACGFETVEGNCGDDADENQPAPNQCAGAQPLCRTEYRSGSQVADEDSGSDDGVV